MTFPGTPEHDSRKAPPDPRQTMPQPAVSTNPDGRRRSRLQEKLLERLREIRAQSDELWRGFSGAWAQTFRAPRFDDAEALFGDCLRQPPRELLEGVLWFAQDLRELVAHDVGKRSLVGETAIAIGLLACERHILNECP